MMEQRMDPPRIFYVHSRRIGPLSQSDGSLTAAWKSALDRAARLGFSQVLLGLPEDTLSPQAEQQQAIEQLVSAAKRLRLQVWLDVSIGELPATSPLAVAHPEWYRSALADRPLDPRLAPALRNLVDVQIVNGRVPAACLECWADMLGAWTAAGVTGLRFHLPHRLPADDWRTLFARLSQGAPGVRLAAWTPGVPADRVGSLRDAGFNAAFTSLAWWDFRAGWFAAERDRLAGLGQLIAFPRSPFDEAVSPGADPALYRRALWAAAMAGEGWMVAMEDTELETAGDIAGEIKAANAFIAKQGGALASDLRVLTGADAAVTVLWRPGPPEDPKRKDAGGLAVLINADTAFPSTLSWSTLRARLPGGYSELVAVDGLPISAPLSGADITLPPAGVAVFRARRTAPVVTLNRPTRFSQKKVLGAAMEAPRVAIEGVTPVIDGGRFALKRALGEPIHVEADIFMDGHDKLAAALLWRAADTEVWQRVPMTFIVNDRWQADFTPERVGRHVFVIEAWYDTFATYYNELSKKHAAGIDVSLELREGRQLLAAMLAEAEAERAVDADVLTQARQLVDTITHDADTEALQHLLAASTGELVGKLGIRHFASRGEFEVPVNVERPAAAFASWYELFPRSQSGDVNRHGTFDDVIERLPAIRDMGFDVLYFPPIHPIGKKNRKGRNNSLVATDNDPGSPYAIGADAGGHDAIHPELGTLEDFRKLVSAAKDHGLELALDFAIQCSPDHPWLRDHPEWFAYRADGSIRYAENPPKKYEDIVNVDFYAPGPRGSRESASTGLWMALRDAVLFWCKEGVRTFRVDNPHTKPLPFWEWMIAEVQGRYPDALFLSEAFTRPKVMYRLAKLGFSQSYTYFTWRNEKQELTDYLVEISQPPVSDLFRPNFFVNTPDINPRFLQTGGRPAHLIRAALATTMSGLWGMYSGFELCEATPVPGKEDYLDSEKYEIRAWDWNRPGNIIGEITKLNQIRRSNPALQTQKGITFQSASNDRVIAYTKATPERDNVVLVVINLDPYASQGAWIELPLWEFGQPDDGALQAEDLFHGHRFTWHGKRQYVQLEPGQPFAMWRISVRS